MGFFDDLVLPGEPVGAREELARLGPPKEDAGRHRPPAAWFAPALVSQLAVAGAGPAAKVMLVGWSVWPRSVTLHLSVHRRIHWGGDALGPGRQSGLRVGLLLADGRRVTSLDGARAGPMDLSGLPEKEAADIAAAQQPTGLIPLDAGMGEARRSLFKTDVGFYLAELPPPGETRLVVEWPDEGIAETSTLIDADGLRAAAAQAVEVWPDLEPPDPANRPRRISMAYGSGPPGFLAPPLTWQERDMLREREKARQRYVPRPDWEGMGHDDWGDAEVLRARVEVGGAPADARIWQGATPLHLAAARGGADALAVLLPQVPDVDVPDGEGNTALWHAACRVEEDCVRALLEAGADAWTPQTGGWSPGGLLLTTELEWLATELPGAVQLPAEEVAAFRAADALTGTFGDGALHTEGLGIAFVRGLDEDEVIRRLGADPRQCPVEAPPMDLELKETLRFVGVEALPGDPGGCVITQDGFLPADEALLRAISPGTAAFGMYFNPASGTPGTLARDGEVVVREEVGLAPRESSPPAHWHFRFWQHGGSFPYTRAKELAYACAAAGMRIADGRAAAERYASRRRVELPPELRRL